MWVQLSECMDIIMTQLSVVTLYNRACGLIGTLPHLWGSFKEFMITSWCGSVHLKYLSIFYLCLNLSSLVTVEDLEHNFLIFTMKFPRYYLVTSLRQSAHMYSYYYSFLCMCVQQADKLYPHSRDLFMLMSSVWIWNGSTPLTVYNQWSVLVRISSLLYAAMDGLYCHPGRKHNNTLI